MKWHFFAWYYLTLVNSMSNNNIPDLNLISEKFTFRERYNMSCVITNSSSAITWITELVSYSSNDRISEFLPLATKQYNCDIGSNKDDYCSNYWAHENEWRIKNSYSDHLSAVTDYRWEDFSTQVTSGDNNFIPISPNVNSNEFKIHISIRTSKDAHIYLCENNDPSTAKCYWIILNGWELNKDKKTVLRKCVKEKVPRTSYPSKDCKTFRDYKDHFYKSYLSYDGWKHFTLEKTYNSIVLTALEDGTELINYQYEDNDIFVRSIIIRTRSYIGYWKFHYYEYAYTEKNSLEKYMGPRMTVSEKQFCVSFFVAMCKNCYLIVEIVDYSTAVISTTQMNSKKPKTWQEEKIIVQNFATLPIEVALRITTSCTNCKSPFWAIDRFRTCSTDEIRVLTIETPRKLPCELVAEQTRTVFLKDTSLADVTEERCPLGTFGKRCTPCTKVLGEANPYCANNVVCELTADGEDTCHCLEGFQGKECQTPCPNGSYGLNCQEACGTCASPPCLAITGQCQVGCHYDFTGPFCKLTKYPFLLNPPSIVDIGHTYFIAEIENKTWDGATSPSFIKLQYKEADEKTWIDTQTFLFNSVQSIRVNQLQVSTSYNVKFVLITSNGNFYNHSKIPEVTIMTTCAFVRENEIKMNTLNTSAIIILSENINEDSCYLEDYNIGVNGGIVTKVPPFQFNITNLEPFTTYDITITLKKSNQSLTFQTTTEEGVATKVQDLVVTNPAVTSISLHWSEPRKRNGNIKHYKIIYQHLRYRDCNNVSSGESSKTILDVRTSTTVENLLPYSLYSFQIAAVTNQDGEFSEIRGMTDETQTPEQSEAPRISNINTYATLAEIILEKPNCSLIKGKIEYRLESYCSNEWCQMLVLNTTVASAFNYVTLTNLIPYSDYFARLTVKRIKGNIQNDPGEFYTFKTKPDVPNEIRELITYSKTNNTLYLRFNPPYPPNGELERYEVNYCYSSSYCASEKFIPKPCTLWENLHCIDLTNLSKNKAYTVKIKAKNKNVAKLSDEIQTLGYTKESKSDPPENISIFWDENDALHLTWSHPNITNGPLTKFLVRSFIEGNNRKRCFTRDHIIEEESRNYTFNFNITFELQECYSSRLDVLVVPFNTEYGNFGSVKIDSPPPIPVLLETPYVQSTSNYTVTLGIPTPQQLSPVSFLYTFVTSADSNLQNNYIEDLLRSNGSLESIPELVAKFNLNSTTPQKLVIGNNATRNGSELKAEVVKPKVLIPETNYVIKVVLINSYMNFTRYKVYTILAKTSGHKPTEFLDGPNYALISLLLLLLLPIIAWVYVRKHKGAISTWLTSRLSNRNTVTTRNPDVIPLSRNIEYPTPRVLPVKPEIPLKQLKPKIPEPQKIQRQSHHAEAHTPDEFSRPINIKDFENYVKQSIANEELEKQHKLFPRGQTKPWEYGALPKNKTKNRYNNLIAYDHTRVKLEKINNDPYSDYINANYIDGYKTKNAYIATQGPKIATVNDFWRMIWQENVSYIVMLANVTEGGKKKTEQYWPNINESVMYGNIGVEFTSTQVFADYHNRTFLVTNDGVERKVEQLHFISWPDHGVPMYAQSLVPLLRRLINIPHGKAPVVVHCSAGVGRTGTVILCDLCLRMALREECIDVLKFQRKLREQRANLVDNIEQYKLVHLLLIEYLINPNTIINCDENTEHAILRLIESEEQENQLRNITEKSWQDQALRSVISFTPNSAWTPKNRFQDIIPGGYGRVYLSRYPTSDEHSDYINAIEVDGFKAPEKFIVTQQPLPNTIPDFWRMVDEKEVLTIVSLNQIDRENNNSCVFWPTKKISKIQPVPYLIVEFSGISNGDFFNVTTLIMHNRKDKKKSKRTIHFIEFRSWPPKQLVPDSVESLLKLWEETEKVTMGEAPIVVTCYNGAQASGLFVTLTFVVEKIKLEQECDICLAVRSVRLNRMQFIEKIEQFTFLYKTAMEYMRGFELYSNFAAINKN